MVLAVERSARIRELCQSAVAAGVLTEPALLRIEKWLADDQYAEYQPAIEEDLAKQNWSQLEAAFGTILPFGTGGRRGVMSPYGTATINGRTIAESAYGLASYLREVLSQRGEVEPPLVVIACDSRHRSLEFARLSAEVCASTGCRVKLFTEPRATPELSFAVRYLEADAGIVISASHNPPADNGFKAYWSNGGQIVPPHDRQILQRIAKIESLPPRTEHVGESALIDFLGSDIDDAYLEALARQSILHLSDEDRAAIRILYTPLHGVGNSSAGEVLRREGFSGTKLFELQSTLDGGFPFVKDHLPNPERDAVFQDAIEFANQSQAQGQGFDLIMATDPDADRLRVAVRDHSSSQKIKPWILLSGNQLGALLVDFALSYRDWPADAYVVQTMVTSPLISRIAKSKGVRVIDKLPVGFKYIGETIDAEGPAGFVFGAEESLGYLAGNYARDKDAALATLWTAELAAMLKARGETLLDRLRQIYKSHGLDVESLWPIRQFADSAQPQEASPSAAHQVVEQIRLRMQHLRLKPPVRRAACEYDEDVSWQQMDDLLERRTWEAPAASSPQIVASLEAGDARPLAEPYPVADMCWLFGHTIEGAEVALALRPSGTEPLLKVYLFSRLAPELWAGEDPLERREVEARRHARMVEKFLAEHFQPPAVSMTHGDVQGSR